jgi:acylphosphatase
MSSRRIHAIVHGRVQGVFFRDSTRQKAQQLGLDGWVRNRPDGTVEAVAEGTPDKVEEMLAWLHRGSSASHVEKVDSREEEPEGITGTGFQIRY